MELQFGDQIVYLSAAEAESLPCRGRGFDPCQGGSVPTQHMVKKCIATNLQRYSWYRKPTTAEGLDIQTTGRSPWLHGHRRQHTGKVKCPRFSLQPT